MPKAPFVPALLLTLSINTLLFSTEANCSNDSGLGNLDQVIIARGPSSYDRRTQRALEKKVSEYYCPSEVPPACYKKVTPVRRPSPPSNENNSKNNSYPTISEIYDEGELIQLSDGSLWQIPPENRAITNEWIEKDTIIVNQLEDPNTPFELSNESNHTTVKAIMKAAPSRRLKSQKSG